MTLHYLGSKKSDESVLPYFACLQNQSEVIVKNYLFPTALNNHNIAKMIENVLQVVSTLSKLP